MTIVRRPLPSPQDIEQAGFWIHGLTGSAESEIVIEKIYRLSLQQKKWVGLPLDEGRSEWRHYNQDGYLALRNGVQICLTEKGLQALSDNTLESHAYRARAAGLFFRPGLDDQLLPTGLLDELLARCGYSVATKAEQTAA